MTSQEKLNNVASVIQCEASRKEVAVQFNNEKIASYYFDRVFDHTASQEFVYRSVVGDLVEDAMKGYNCTVIAYGQTGTGKTFTMEGHRTECKGDSVFWFGERAGMIPRAAQHIFQRMSAICDNYTVKVSCVEIYNEEIIDLLVENEQKVLNILSDENNHCDHIVGLDQITVKSPEEIFKLLEIATQKRSIAETLLNKRSSRSHCIFTITIEQKDSVSGNSEPAKIGKLNLVDLAGSENTKKSGVTGLEQKQATMINKSLLTLRRVITALTSNEKSKHIPYRDSKLTRLLRESLGGGSKTCMIATISTSEDCLEETRSTLQYAFSAKSIKNQPVLNQKLTNTAPIQEYKGYIETLREQLATSRSSEGFYVDPQTWNNYAELTTKIQNLENTLVEKDEKIIELQQKCDQLAVEIELCTKKRKQIQLDLFQKREVLQTVTKQLEEGKLFVNDQIIVIKHRQQIEEALAIESKNLITSFQSSWSDIEYLQTALKKYFEIQTYNDKQRKKLYKKLLENFKYFVDQLKVTQSNSHTRNSNLSNLFNSLEQNHVDLIVKLSTDIDEFINSLTKQFNSFKNNSNKLIKNHSRFFEEKLENYQKLFEKNQQENVENYSKTIENSEKIRTADTEYLNLYSTWKNQFSSELGNSISSHTAILNDQRKYLDQSNNLTSDFLNQQNSTYENQKQWIESVRQLFYESMLENKAKFLKRVESIYEKHMNVHLATFDKSLASFQEAMESTKTISNDYSSSYSSFLSNMNKLLENQFILQKNLSESLLTTNNNIFSTTGSFISSKSSIIDQVQEQVKSIPESQKVEFSNFLNNTKNQFGNHVKELQTNQNQIFSSLDLIIQENSDFNKNKVAQNKDAFQKFISQSTFPTTVAQAQVKEDEFIENQIKQTQSISQQLDKYKSQLQNYKSVGNTPKKRDTPAVPESLPCSLSLERISELRATGELQEYPIIDVLALPPAKSPVNRVSQKVTPTTPKNVQKLSERKSEENISPLAALMSKPVKPLPPGNKRPVSTFPVKGKEHIRPPLKRRKLPESVPSK